MNDALYIAATGMRSQSTQVQTIANNVANVNTPGFKRGSVHFADLVQAPVSAEALAVPGQAWPPEVQALLQGAGVGISHVVSQMQPAQVKASQDPMDLAIDGAGMLEVQLPDGSTAYARGGRLVIQDDGLLGLAGGAVLQPRIQVPAELHQLRIAEDGRVEALDAQARAVTLGRLEVSLLPGTVELQAIGQGLYRAEGGRVEAQLMPSGMGGAGSLKQGHLEASNVSLVEEMVQLMLAQRAYEMNVKVAQAADELAGLTNNLRK